MFGVYTPDHPCEWNICYPIEPRSTQVNHLCRSTCQSRSLQTDDRSSPSASTCLEGADNEKGFEPKKGWQNRLEPLKKVIQDAIRLNHLRLR